MSSKTKLIFEIEPKDGTIYIGDIGYIINEEVHNDWAINGYADGAFVLNGLNYGAFSTACGDGSYTSSLGEFPVDTGTIGFAESGLFKDNWEDSIAFGAYLEDVKKLIFEVSSGCFLITIDYNNGDRETHSINTKDDLDIEEYYEEY